jgi:hypothetical protein
MPAIHTSTVTFNSNHSYTRFLTSEGTSYTRREPSITFNVSAATQAADGTMLDDFVWFHGRSLAEIPSQNELATRIQDLGKYLTDLRDAPTLESYSGPVLAEVDAAPQMIRAITQVVVEEHGLIDLPIVTCMDFGHTDPMLVLPYGVNARIDSEPEEFTIIDAAVTDPSASSPM